MSDKPAVVRDFWSFLGKVAFIFAVLWLFGLLYGFMVFGLLAVGAVLCLVEGYRLLFHRGSKQSAVQGGVLDKYKLAQSLTKPADEDKPKEDLLAQYGFSQEPTVHAVNPYVQSTVTQTETPVDRGFVRVIDDAD